MLKLLKDIIAESSTVSPTEMDHKVFKHHMGEFNREHHPQVNVKQVSVIHGALNGKDHSVRAQFLERDKPSE